jgi:hypothetical protein
VVPGKTQADVQVIVDRFKADPAAYFESRGRLGVTLERAYWQHTPMGDFVVAYVESDRSPAEVATGFGEGATELDRFFAAHVKEVHGVDITQPPAGPPAQTVGEWVDPDVTTRKRGMAFCAPLIAEQEERGQMWAKETFGSEGMTRSRRALRQNIEVVTVNYTPNGPVAGVYLEGDDPFEANRNFAASTDEFDVRFKQELATLFPPFIDFSQPVPGVTELFDSLSLRS